MSNSKVQSIVKSLGSNPSQEQLNQAVVSLNQLESVRRAALYEPTAYGTGESRGVIELQITLEDNTPSAYRFEKK